MRVFFALLCSLSLASNAGTITGQVVVVSDGDTITVLDANSTSHKVRLSGIDAPERAQPFGNRSKESLSDLVFGKDVAVETSKRDRYGRYVGKTLIDGADVNLMQIQRGLAWHYKAYEREQSTADRQVYAEAEREARLASRGLWKDSQPISPWLFRLKIRTNYE